MLPYFKAPIFPFERTREGPHSAALPWVMGFGIRKMIPLVLSMSLLVVASSRRTQIALNCLEQNGEFVALGAFSLVELKESSALIGRNEGD